jgi:NAD-dependent SIR2 family protein deacetylase
MLTYCLKCKKKTESKNVKPATDKRGNKYHTAECSSCGGKKAIRGMDKMKESVDGEGLSIPRLKGSGLSRR